MQKMNPNESHYPIVLSIDNPLWHLSISKNPCHVMFLLKLEQNVTRSAGVAMKNFMLYVTI